MSSPDDLQVERCEEGGLTGPAQSSLDGAANASSPADGAAGVALLHLALPQRPARSGLLDGTADLAPALRTRGDVDRRRHMRSSVEPHTSSSTE